MPEGFKNYHPTPSARQGRVPGSESNLVHCKQCGFIVDTSKVARGEGDGITITDGIPVVSGGCPHCGSKNY